MSTAFEALFEAVAAVLSFFYSLWPSYGVAIILLTLAVMVVMTPLTLKGTRSMMAMQRLQPEMKRIQERYKDDREKLNEELLKFYKENNINPLGGCLPLLLQMPVFIVLFGVLRGLTRRVTEVGITTGWTAALAQQGGDPVAPPGHVTEQTFDPAYLDHTSEMYNQLAGSTKMDWLGMDLAQSASQALSDGILHALPYLVMIGVVAASGWYQQKQTQARSSSEVSDQQKMIGRVMLFFLPAISFGMPAGIVLYFVVSNLYRIGQQAYITRTLYRGEGGQSGAKGKDPEPKGPSPEDGERRKESRPAGKPSPGKGRTGGGRVSEKKSVPKKKPAAGKKTYTSDPRERRRGPARGGEVEPRPRQTRKKR